MVVPPLPFWVWTVRPNAWTAPQAQRAQNRRPKSRCLALQPTHDIGRRIRCAMFYVKRVSQVTHNIKQKSAEKCKKCPQSWAIFYSTTETRLVSVAKRVSLHG